MSKQLREYMQEMFDRDIELLPEHIRDGLHNYVFEKIQPGHFLTAVLENNLKEAVARADATNQKALSEIVRFLYNGVPSICWGSPERVNNWLASRASTE